MKYFFFIMLIPFQVYTQWEPEFRLVLSYATTSESNSWCIKNSGDTVHIAFVRSFGLREISYLRSTNNGTDWSTETNISHDSGVSKNPCINVSNGIIHVVWEDYRDTISEIYYNHSTNGGITWGNDQRLTNGAARSEFPMIASDGMNIHITWYDQRDGNYEIYYKRSTDGGFTWSSDMRLTNDTYISQSPTIAASGQNIHIAWNDSRNGTSEIYYKKSIDNGSTWSADIRLTNNVGISNSPSIAVYGANVHVIWQDNRNIAYGIYYKRSSDNGQNWTVDTTISSLINGGLSYNANIAVVNSKVHIVWCDGRLTNNSEIFYAFSSNSGLSWNGEVRLSYGTSWSDYPSISANDTSIHVVWQDDRINSTTNLFYKRNTSGIFTGLININSMTPSYYFLSQNFPNPFNPETKIQFGIKENSHSKIIIYDIIGKEVDVLVDKFLTEGVYEISWMAKNLPSGIYYYKLTSGNFSEARKMILLK